MLVHLRPGCRPRARKMEERDRHRIYKHNSLRSGRFLVSGALRGGHEPGEKAREGGRR